MAKTCITCRHYVPDCDGSRFSRCHAPQNVKEGSTINLVTGEPAEPYRFIFCTSHRIDDEKTAVALNTCGAAGRWHEPKAESEAA